LIQRGHIDRDKDAPGNKFFGELMSELRQEVPELLNPL
jgi:hypothetical protein